MQLPQAQGWSIHQFQCLVRSLQRHASSHVDPDAAQARATAEKSMWATDVREFAHTISQDPLAMQFRNGRGAPLGRFEHDSCAAHAKFQRDKKFRILKGFKCWLTWLIFCGLLASASTVVPS